MNLCVCVCVFQNSLFLCVCVGVSFQIPFCDFTRVTFIAGCSHTTKRSTPRRTSTWFGILRVVVSIQPIPYKTRTLARVPPTLLDLALHTHAHTHSCTHMHTLINTRTYPRAHTPQGEFEKAVSGLLPLRYHLGTIGGSKAQQDVAHLTLVDAALRLPDQVRYGPGPHHSAGVSGKGRVGRHTVVVAGWSDVACREVTRG